MGNIIFLVVFVLELILLVTSQLAQAVPAFPGAEGFAANSIGGRGGKVIEVTNLNDSGTGSFRAALEASGPRTVIFRLGGTILLNSIIHIKNPYLTIAGQSAPGGGIAIRGNAVSIETHDVIVRYMRFRPGNLTTLTDALNSYNGADNVIVDHCSLTWGSDEILSTYGDNGRITYQWNIIAEALSIGSVHGKGSLLGGGANHKLSFHHNLMSHNIERNPRPKTNGTVDIVNNVVNNPGFSGGWGPSHITFFTSGFTPKVNYVGNYYKPGPASGSASYFVSIGDPSEVYVSDNIVPHAVVNSGDSQYLVSARLPADLVTTTKADIAYVEVLSNVGATLPSRDAADNRIINDVKNGTGGMITDPATVGGYPLLAVGTPEADFDHDGMPDSFEASYGFDTKNAADGTQDADADGFTNLEEFLNRTNPKVKEGQIANTVPSVTIQSPVSGSTFVQGAAVNFSGSATDTEDGNLSAIIVWKSSLNGNLGSGANLSVSNLLVGTHTITATVTDSGGLSKSTTINLTVTQLPPSNTVPSVTIQSPVSGSTFVQGAAVNFSGAATDTEDGNLSAIIVWKSSLNGNLGSGANLSVSNLLVGTHTITATVTDSGGLSKSTTINLIVAQSNIVTELKFPVREDAYVRGTYPTKNYGSETKLICEGEKSIKSLLKFVINGVGTRTVVSAKLMIYVDRNGSDYGGAFYRVTDNSWSESKVTWNNFPARESSAFTSLGKVSTKHWYEVDVSSLIQGDGTISMAILQSTSTRDGVYYKSKESGSSYAPYIVVKVK
jgi:hypothetical protein